MPLKKSFIDFFNVINRGIFEARGKKPWRMGYTAYKESFLKKTLKEGSFNAEKLPHGYGLRIDERAVEYPWLFSRLPSGKGNLLDAGSVLNFDYILSQKALVDKKIFISTLAPERDCYWKNGISYVFEDLRDECFRDDFFDWIVSLSTIEHVGMDNSMLYTDDLTKKESDKKSYLHVIRQLRRVLKPGGTLYLSFPFGRHKDHGWFQVFDSKMVDELIKTFSPSKVTECHFKYEPHGWQMSTREESKDATCFDIHFQKNYDADYAAFSRGVVCLEMVK